MGTHILEKQADGVWKAKETDPNGLGAKDPGSKLDFGKSPIVRGAIKYFPRALLAVADLSQHGADKYSWKGWEKVSDGIQRYDDAMGRHMAGEVIEGEFDQTWMKMDRHVLHATAVAWNALARLELILREKENHVEKVV